MKRKRLLSVLIISGVVFILIGYGIYHFFFNMNNLPEGEFHMESISPQSTYTVKLYVHSSALSSDGIRGEVINNKTGKKRNIYWAYARYLFGLGISEYTILWESDEIVIINGQRLNVKKDIYDYRRN